MFIASQSDERNRQADIIGSDLHPAKKSVFVHPQHMKGASKRGFRCSRCAMQFTPDPNQPDRWKMDFLRHVTDVHS
jgi:hypothetical protein